MFVLCVMTGQCMVQICFLLTAVSSLSNIGFLQGEVNTYAETCIAALLCSVFAVIFMCCQHVTARKTIS